VRDKAVTSQAQVVLQEKPAETVSQVQASADKKRASKLPASLPPAARIVWVGVGPEKANPSREGSARAASRS
jgi:hypothetical protein